MQFAVRLFSVFIFLFGAISLVGQIMSPSEHHPTQYGKQFTPHHVLVDYYEHVAANSDQVKLMEYGRTNQDRPLLLAFVSSTENIDRLEEIRKKNISLTGLDTYDGALDEDIAIVWLSFSIHGNEAGGAEASPSVLYELLSDEYPENKEWLKNTVVIMDISVNPDGYSRYTHWIRNVGGLKANEDPHDIEHNEPWPGGRVNHYLFDLNRDWAWQTQIESQKRMDQYNNWMPHILADLHEQGFNNPYYFAPAAKPYHEYISEWQRNFQVEIGKNHARYFDNQGWLYFTKEIFDLFYPSYGDTYPTFHGAIGMTYEQAGHSRGGRAIKTESNQVLTLQDRIDHHKTTALSTIETASKSAARIVNNFKQFFATSINNPQGKFRSYVIKNEIDRPDKLRDLMLMLDRQRIQYKTVNSDRSLNGYDYNRDENASFKVQEGDIVVSAHQPKGVLAQVLLDPVSSLEDSLTYDITAWSLPIAYGLQAYGLDQNFEGEDFREQVVTESPAIAQDIYGVLIPWGGVEQASMVAHLHKHKVNFRYSTKPYRVVGKSYREGTIMITKADNRANLPDFKNEIVKIVQTKRGRWIPITTGWAESGPDLGSSYWTIAKMPKVVTIRGEGVGTNAFGQVKFFMEKELDYPLTIINKDALSSSKLSGFNTLILPDGYYRLSEGQLSAVSDWVSAGGKVLAIGNANRSFADQKGYALASFATDKDKSASEKEREEIELKARYNRFHNQDRRSIANEVPGAIFETVMDNSHPLGFAMEDRYFTLKTSRLAYPPLKGAWNVSYTEKDARVIGFVGSNAKKKLMDTVSYAHESKGNGQVIYMIDNPLFRMFWQNGKQIFCNGLFF